MVASLDSIKSDIKNLYIKKKQESDVEYILWEIEKVQEGMIEHLKNKTKLDKFIERHIIKEVHPNSDI